MRNLIGSPSWLVKLVVSKGNISTGFAPYLFVMPFCAELLTLTDEQRDELRRVSLSRSLPASDVFRARLILMLAEGRSYAEVQQRLDTSAPTVARWRQRFVEHGIAGILKGQHPGRIRKRGSPH